MTIRMLFAASLASGVLSAVQATDFSWRAKWIAGAPETYADADMTGARWIASGKNQREAAKFSRKFNFKGVKDGEFAELVLVATSRHRVEINGRLCDELSDMQDRWFAARFIDITPYLKSGQNEISITVKLSRVVPDVGGVCAVLAQINLPGGASLGTDATWQCDDGVKDLGFSREPAFARHVLMRTESTPPAFEKKFNVLKDVKSAKLYITGVGFYEAHLNGRKIGEKVLDPSFTDFSKRVLYSVYDLAGGDGRLDRGENTLKIILGHGWYDVRSIAVWNFSTAPWRDTPRTIAQLEIEYADGTRETVVTDGTWRHVTSPVLYDCIREGEVLTDCALPSKGVVGADGQALFASEVAGPDGVLELAAHPATKITDMFRPTRIAECGGGTYLVEFPYDIAGWVRFRPRAQKKGDVLVIRYDERADAGPAPVVKRVIDQHFRHTASHRVCAKDAGFQVDRYICSGRDGETYEPRFTYNGFRYVTLKGLRAPPRLEDLTACRIRTGFDQIGSFECSDPVFTELVAMGVRSYLSNFVNGYPMDCPHREKNGWTGDASIASELAQYVFENTAAYRKWLVDIMDTQLPSGDICCIVPTSGWGYAWGNGPAWDSALSVIAWNLYLYRDDREVLDVVYPALVRYLEYTATKANADGLVKHGLGDWIPVSKMPSVEFTSSCYYYQAQRICGFIAGLKGLVDEKEKWGASAERTRCAINAKFYKGDGVYDDGGQTAQAVPVTFGIVEPSELGRCAAKLVESVERTDRHVDMGLLGTKHVFRALSVVGRSDLAYAMLTNPTKPSPVEWLQKGGTTLWEDWDDGFSRNHIMFGDFIAWAYQYLAGIRLPDAEGSTPAMPLVENRAFSHVLIAPDPVPQLSWAKASVDGPNGKINVSWKVLDGNFLLEVALTGKVTATVRMPDGTEYMAAAGSSRFTCPFGTRHCPTQPIQ